MDITPYVEGHKSRIKDEEQRRLTYYKKAYERAEKIAEALREEFPNIEVYLIGSLTTNAFDLDSDIDIAVKQLAEEDYFKAYRIAEDIAEPFPLDFIQFEFAQESMKERILRDGVRV
ncbi:nucleotidyltransferase family protein [Desulfosporosinus lacus]|uniref:Predicted nucleotidyltransferase n=1 Tax=Desulfosporosinus lacus DSM 15449 TaxID=1121420 RepID=A0A1M6A8V5_9FIRM|nr:nucleotidyltransferase domain-containing protein [Desulfosporosinus lacus]SHI32856.1 Predicted nucleotidyltransferase [Desulfosporosinus lacus DSM 15449]